MSKRRTEKKSNDKSLDPSIHRRILRYLNNARTSADIMIAPHDRIMINEEEAHRGHIDHHLKKNQIIKKDLAKLILDERNRRFPARGFGNIDDVIAIDNEIADNFGDMVTAFGPANYGRWDLLYDLEIDGVEFSIEHSALLHTKEVIFLGDSTDTVLWDPSNEVSPLLSKLSPTDTNLTSNLVCCGHSFLSDGQLLAVGGGGLGPGAATSIEGWRFDPINRKWTKTLGNMSIQRWYPTVVTLGDEGPTERSGRSLIASGAFPENPLLEIYSEATDTFSLVRVSGPISKSFAQTYPGLHLLPGGEIFYVPTGFGNCSTGDVYPLNDPSAYFTFSGALEGSWTEIGTGINRTKGMSALLLQSTYPFVRAIVVGGGDSGSNQSAQTINLSTFSPLWGTPSAIPDGRPRVNVNVVLLLDNTVLVCGGTQSPPHTCWRYNPNTAITPWSEMDELNSPRHYHSCVLLLPNGKVMAAGGAAPGGCTVSVENSIEVFNPPYLFNQDGTFASRPTIVSIDGITPNTEKTPTIEHGGSFVIETPESADIAKVVLVRPMANTHNTDTEQRIINCSFVKTDANTITGNAPNGMYPHAMAPRGYYMLFIINNKGVPSEAEFIHLH